MITISVGHDVDLFVHLLKRDATVGLVGSIEPLTKVKGAL